MKPLCRLALFAVVSVATVPSHMEAQALPPGIGRIVFDDQQIVHFAYVPERTTHGTPLHWLGSCVFIRPHSAGTTHIEGDLEQSVIAAVVDHWQASTRGCGYLSFLLEPAEPGEVGLDYINRIIFREDRWCQPATTTTPELCHDPSTGAITTLLYVDNPGSPYDGMILDADIEINAVDYSVGICDSGRCTTAGSPRVIQDLANQLTHEIGHLVGLGHTCWVGTGSAPTDTDGTPILWCNDPDLSFDARTSSMFPVSIPEETRRASLSPSDIEDFCEIYPLAEDPRDCAPAGTRDAGPVPDDAGAPTRDAGTDGGMRDASLPDSGLADLGTTPPNTDATAVPDATAQRDAMLHTVPFKDEGCACAIGQGPRRTSWLALVLLGLTGAAALLRRRRH